MTTELTNYGQVAIDGVPISGPGVPEPPAAFVAKAWSVVHNSKALGTFRQYFWRLIDGRVLSYHPTKGFKIWRPKKPVAVIYRGKMRLDQYIRISKEIDKMTAHIAKKVKGLKRK